MAAKFARVQEQLEAASSKDDQNEHCERQEIETLVKEHLDVFQESGFFNP